MNAQDSNQDSLPQASELAESRDSVTYCAGSVIFREGDHGDRAYIIEEGEVRVVRRRDGCAREIARLGPGELLGEMAPIDDMRRSATAIASVDACLTPISRQSIEALVENADPILRLLVRLLLQRLRSQVADSEPGAGTEVATEPTPEVAAALGRVRKLALGRVRMRRALAEAITSDQLLLHFQPIVDLRDWQACGVEALIRWSHPERGLVLPEHFIPMAEETGLIHAIGQWSLRNVCETVHTLSSHIPSSVGRSFFVSVNVSPQQLCTLDQVDQIIGTVRDSGVDASRIKIEVTERLLIENPDVAVRGLSRIRDAGMTVAIDDFGTGYSSLSYLHKFPLDTLKLDLSFVDRLSESRERRAVVEAVVGLAKRLRMEVVAEGVERVDDLRALYSLGVPMVQGFLLGKPIPVDGLRHWSVAAERDEALGIERPPAVQDVA